MNFFETYVSPDSIELVNTCMKKERLSAGLMADIFEQELSDTLKVVNPVVVNSGTSALHLAMILAGVKGYEVILPAQTFIATGTAIKYAGGYPIFCDISAKDGNIDVEEVKKHITPRTMAIVAVHWAGYPCDMDGLLELGQKHNIKIIEDAAHALNATYKGSPIGSISDFTCFSFQAIKHLTTGDGGAICCKNPKDATVAKNLRWFDIDRNNSQADILGERVYDATHTGYKYHMNDFAACMGIGNLRRVRDNITKVREIAARYNDELKDVAGVTLMDYKPDRQSSYWLYPMIVENRVRFIQKLKEAGIPTSVVHVGIDKNSIFGIKRESLVNQRFFDQNQIHIPINFKLTTEEVSHIIATIKGGW